MEEEEEEEEGVVVVVAEDEDEEADEGERGGGGGGGGWGREASARHSVTLSDATRSAHSPISLSTSSFALRFVFASFFAACGWEGACASTVVTHTHTRARTHTGTHTQAQRK